MVYQGRRRERGLCQLRVRLIVILRSAFDLSNIWKIKKILSVKKYRNTYKNQYQTYPKLTLIFPTIYSPASFNNGKSVVNQKY